MKPLVISKIEQQKLLRVARATGDVARNSAILMMLALADGQSYAEVARLFRMDEALVVELRRKFDGRYAFADWLSEMSHPDW